jgi:hypothetical protein
MTKAVKAFKCERTGRMFPTAELARASEDKLSKTKIAELQRRIKSGKYWTPKKGDVIYVRTSMSCDHGWDDVTGGLALVTEVKCLSGGDPNTPFVKVAQHGDRGGYNWQILFDEQKELAERFKGEIAHPDPDYGPGGDQYDPHEWH